MVLAGRRRCLVVARSPVQREVPDRVRVPLTAELLVRRYVEQGAAAERIAADTGWSGQYVRERLREHGIALRPAGFHKTSSLDRAGLAALLDQGLSVAQIASAASCSRSGVYALMRRWQLSATATRPNTAKWAAAAELETVARLYRDEQRSLTDVGECFGRGQKWARARVLAAGVPLRRGGTPAGRSDDRYPDLDASQLVRWYHDGLTVAQLAVRTGRSRSVVSTALRAAGVVVTGSTRPAPDAAVARELYLGQRLTLAQAGARLGCSSKRVAAVLKTAGVALRPSGRPASAPPLAPVDPELLRELYVNQQLTQQEIAERLGGGASRIATALTTFGIPRRPPAQRRPPPAFELDATTLLQLYVTEHLDDKSIGVRYGVPAWHVKMRRRELQVRRPAVAPPHPAPPRPPAADVLRRLYLDEHTPIAVIAVRFRTAPPKVRGWLVEANIPIRPRTARAHRITLDPATLRELYTAREWTAAEIAAEFNTTTHLVLRGLHDHAIPVRRGGTRRTQRLPGEPPTRLLLAALYADRQVSAVLRRHQVPRRPQPGPIADRFPTAIELTRALLVELYMEVGLAARQIELLTGQPHQQILDAMHAHSIAVGRDRSAASPWLARQPHQ